MITHIDDRRDTPVARIPAPEATVAAELRRRARERGDAPFLTMLDEGVTYAEADERSDRMAEALSGAGVRAGDLVAIFMFNSLELVLATFALAKLGAASVPINTDYKGELLRYVLQDSQARVAIVDDELFDRVVDVLGESPALERLIVRTEAAETPTAPIPVDRLADLRGAGPVETPHRRASDLYMVLYTSGTTGPSKGVMISNGHCLAFATDWVTVMEFTSEDVLYGPLPLFHGIAYMLGVLAVMRAGGHMHLRRRFSASRFWDDVRATRATVAHVVFSIVPILLSAPASDRDRDHSVRAVYIGPSKLSNTFEERFGAKVVEVYGQSETGIVTWGTIGRLPSGSCGKVNGERFEVRLVDEHDRDVPTGEVGEIVVRPRRPDTMMLGYLNKPDETARTWRNLWHHSGDRGFADADGWVYFADRAKDCIRRRGENISSYEIELIAGAHPGVEECAAIPVPSALEEEEVKICVVRTPGSTLTAEELHAYCVANMPRFMVPRYIEFADAFPKTPSQKVEKYKLRQAGRDGLTDATWDAEGSHTR